MATRIILRNPATGLIKRGFYGFSWTTLFFGFIVPLIRRKFLWAVVMLTPTLIIGALSSDAHAANFLSLVLVNLPAACFINRSYTRNLLERGYAITGATPQAYEKLGVTMPSGGAQPTL